MKIRVVEVYNGGDREVDVNTTTLDWPELTVKAVKQYLINQFEVEEEEGANINEMFAFQKKGPVIVANATDDFQVFMFTPC